MSPHNVRVGQRVNVQGKQYDYSVLSITDDGVTAYPVTLAPYEYVAFIPFEHLVMPEAPKATAGVIYQRVGYNTKAVGLSDGRVMLGYPCNINIRDFDPVEFVKAEP